MEYLQCKGYSVTSLVYSTATCWVYRGKHPGCPNCTPEVAIKIQSFSTQPMFDRAFREIENQVQLHHHPNVVQLFEYFYEPTSDNRMLLFLVLEWVEKDLMKDLEQRRINHFPWSEIELDSVVCDLIRVLARAQELGICHRNIKPQNIFYDSVKKVVKLGNFGSSAAGIISGIQRASVVGTVMCMSEELKTAVVAQSHHISHNVVKSDVYALGITLLILTKLSVPHSVVMQFGNQAAMLWNEISALQYSDRMKRMIWNMLNPCAEERYTFTQLESEYCPIVSEAVSQTLPSELPYQNLGQYPEEDLKLQYSNSKVPPFSAQQPFDGQYQEYPCEQTANQVVNPLYVQEQSNRIGRHYTNPIPTTIMKSDADLCCIQCGTEMSTVSKTKSIVITCPEGHTMNHCARTCFIAHVESVTREYTRDFICFRCGLPINQETVIQFYGGVDAFDIERTKAAQRELMCVACKNYLATHSLANCGHIYCKKCLYGIKEFLKYKYTCKLCGTISHKKHNLLELPFWRAMPPNYKGKKEAKSAKLI